MIRLFLLSSFFFLTGICFAQQEGKIMIYGQIDTVPGSIYEVSYLDWKNNRIVDTITTRSEGKFEHEVFSNEPLLIHLNLDNTPDKPWYDEGLVGPYPAYYFWAEPGKSTYFRGFGIGKQEVENSEMERISSAYSAELFSSPDWKDRSKRNGLADSLRMVYLQKEPSYFSLVLLWNMLRDDSADLDFAQATFDGLPAELKETGKGQQVRARLFVAKNTSIGKVMPDFEIRDEAGKPVGLKGFRGEVPAG